MEADHPSHTLISYGPTATPIWDHHDLFYTRFHTPTGWIMPFQLLCHLSHCLCSTHSQWWIAWKSECQLSHYPRLQPFPGNRYMMNGTVLSFIIQESRESNLFILTKTYLQSPGAGFLKKPPTIGIVQVFTRSTTDLCLMGTLLKLTYLLKVVHMLVYQRLWWKNKRFKIK